MVSGMTDGLPCWVALSRIVIQSAISLDSFSALASLQKSSTFCFSQPSHRYVFVSFIIGRSVGCCFRQRLSTLVSCRRLGSHDERSERDAFADPDDQGPESPGAQVPAAQGERDRLQGLPVGGDTRSAREGTGGGVVILEDLERNPRAWLIEALTVSMTDEQAERVVDALDAYLEEPDRRMLFEDLTPD